MQKLLNDINCILEKDKQDKEQRNQNGDSFNLFQSLCISTNELVHSKMIAELLNPNGAHRKGSIFLEKFLSIYNIGFKIDTKTAMVSTEYNIGTITKDYSYGGKIDVLVSDADKHALIIENKIYAGDQKKQLYRYAKYAKQNHNKYIIVYLTLDCHEPTTFSTGKKPDYEYIMYSYEDDILPWLDECMKECIKGSILYNSILQYSQCVRKLLKLMNVETENNIVNIATDKKNINSALALFDNEKAIKKKIIDNFVEALCVKAKNYGFTPNVDLFGDKKGATISFCIPKQSKKWALFFECNKKNVNDVAYFISLISGKTSKIKKTDLTNIPHIWQAFEQEKNKPCGWSYFWSESGERYSGNWYNWYDNKTLQAMVDGRLLDFITDTIFSPIKEKNILKILNKY